MFKELALILIDIMIIMLVACGSATIAVENGWDIFWITIPALIVVIRLMCARS